MVNARLPQPPTPLIGRDEELGDVIQRLTDPTCRLLTLLGPGGIGKTRLALQAAIEGEEQFAEGACFVDLQPLETAEFLPVAIADALELPLSGQQEPEIQLKNYLRGQKMLLVLDNFEHLLPAGVKVVERILASGPDVTLLVTSREALNLREEWLYPLSGLPFPPSDHEKEPGTYGAVQLFVERARRVQPDFSLDDESRAVVRICRLVEGMPLALELAASWMRVLNCAAIADQIQEDVAFLTSSVRNVPDKHRSMQAIFDRSWRLLGAGEQDAYKRLSVFRGGFTLKAAEAVAGASLPVLSTLANKSLLRPGEGGRYHLHELLRQYAEERLDQSAAEAAQVRRLHCDYYVDLLSRHSKDFKGGKQQEAVARIELDRENVRAAWQRAVEQKRVSAMRKALYPFAYFAEFKGRYAEIIGALERALNGLEAVPAGQERDRALAEVLVLLGWSYIRVGRHGKAQIVLERGRAIYQNLEATPPEVLATDPLLGLAILAIISGDYERALSLAEEGLHLGKERGDPHNRQLAFYALSSATLAQGEYERARRYARQAYDVTQETGNEWFRAYVLNDLGRVAQAMGQYDQARQHFEASYAIKESFNDPEGQGVALNHLGAVAWRQHDLEKAGELYRRSVAIYQEIGDRGGLATALNGLGNTALAKGDLPSARHRLRQALDIAADIHYVPLILSVLAGVGELLLRAGKTRRGVELLTLVEGHPAGEEETKERARRCLEWAGGSPEGTDQPLRERPIDLIARCRTVLDVLRALTLPDKDEDERKRGEGTRFVSPSGQRLAEPLTERELEVLQHIGRGLTNQEVADELVISVGTVKWYTSQIYGKLDVGNRTAAVARARELGILR